jgi:hypothetical protein
VDVSNVGWQDGAHFFAISAQMMRRILVDAARARASAKRGGDVQAAEHSTALYLDQIADVSSGRDREVVAHDAALDKLGNMDPRKAQVIELLFLPKPAFRRCALVNG